MLRIDTRPSSARSRARRTNSLRRSSVRSGKTTRMTLPSLDGFSPRSLVAIARSMPLSADASYGDTSSMRGSGTETPAICCSGVGAP